MRNLDSLPPLLPQLATAEDPRRRNCHLHQDGRRRMMVTLFSPFLVHLLLHLIVPHLLKRRWGPKNSNGPNTLDEKVGVTRTREGVMTLYQMKIALIDEYLRFITQRSLETFSGRIRIHLRLPVPFLDLRVTIQTPISILSPTLLRRLHTEIISSHSNKMARKLELATPTTKHQFTLAIPLIQADKDPYTKSSRTVVTSSPKTNKGDSSRYWQLYLSSVPLFILLIFVVIAVRFYQHLGGAFRNTYNSAHTLPFHHYLFIHSRFSAQCSSCIMIIMPYILAHFQQDVSVHIRLKERERTR